MVNRLRDRITVLKRVLILIILILTTWAILYVCLNGIQEGYENSATDVIPENISFSCIDVTQKFYPTKKHMDAIELCLTNLPEARTGYVTVIIQEEDKLLYQTNIQLSDMQQGIWHKVYTGLQCQTNKEYSIKINAYDYETIPNVMIVDTASSPSENTDCSINGEIVEGSLLIRYGYTNNISNLEKCLHIIIYLLSAFGLIWLILYCNEYKRQIANFGIMGKFINFIRADKHSYILTLINELACFLTLNLIGIEFKIGFKILIYITVFIASWMINKTILFILEEFKNGASKSWMIILLLFSAFSLVGNNLFTYPISMKLSLLSIVLYLFTVLWMTPIIFLLIYIMSIMNFLSITSKRRISLKFYLLCGIIIFIPCIICLYAYNPGISSPDTRMSLAVYAHAIQNMPNWYPPFYSLCLKIIIEIWDSTYAIVLVQCAFFIFVYMEGVIALLRLGLKKEIILTSTILISLNTGNIIQFVTIWKDIPYAISLLWLTIIISKLMLEMKFYKKKVFIYIELCVALVFVCLLRQNGIVPFALSVLMLIILFRKNHKTIITVVLSCMLVILIRFPLYNYIGVTEANTGGEYIGLAQDIMGVYYSDGNVSDETLEMITVLTDYNISSYSYSPYWSFASYDLDISMPEFIRNYVDTFIKNPILMTNSIVCRLDAVYNITLGKEGKLGCVNYHWTEDGNEVWNKYYPIHKDNAFTGIINYIGTKSTEIQLLNILEWRAGIWTLFSLLTLYVIIFIKKKGILILLFVPWIGQILSLYLSTGWSDFRYYWPLILISYYLILLQFTLKKEV